MSLQSALLGFLLSRLLPLPISSSTSRPHSISSRGARLWRWTFTPLTPQENVVLQTTATATGTMPLAAGYVGILPALAVLDPVLDGSEPVVLSWGRGVLWGCAVAFFG
jgi:uncharacterized oligopeptide transporter (OPT) family protein